MSPLALAFAFDLPLRCHVLIAMASGRRSFSPPCCCAAVVVCCFALFCFWSFPRAFLFWMGGWVGGGGGGARLCFSLPFCCLTAALLWNLPVFRMTSVCFLDGWVGGGGAFRSPCAAVFLRSCGWVGGGGAFRSPFCCRIAAVLLPFGSFPDVFVCWVGGGGGA